MSAVRPFPMAQVLLVVAAGTALVGLLPARQAGYTAVYAVVLAIALVAIAATFRAKDRVTSFNAKAAGTKGLAICATAGLAGAALIANTLLMAG